MSAAAAVTPVIQRANLWVRIRAWLRLAYTDIGSKEHQVLLEWIIWMVILSVVTTVLQHDHALDEQYHLIFQAIEVVILFAFIADYTLNLVYAPSRRGYALSFAGIVDLLAIVPSAFVFVDASSIKFLRSLRFLRILQVVKAMRDRASAAGDDEHQSRMIDLQLGVIFISALLLLVPDDALRNQMLGVTLITAITTGVRRWLVLHQQLALSVFVLVGTVVAAMFYALGLDSAGHQDWAIGLLLATVVIALITWMQTEAPAGGL